ncbi:GNAT family N-acetyltransferase [Nocardia sp. NPDC057663]|uniref:GNAT family N-acetyltransferase n=1 Tax=Nocardia sp. NPDC057663 TaxID=3346201 RepID=UPI00366B50B7
MESSNKQAELRFRSATVDDLAAIAELESHEFMPLAYPYFALRQLFDIHGSQWVVADLAGAVCGYALVAVGKRTAWLIGLAVSARYQGRGLGRSLLDRAVTRCRSAQVEAIFITVRPSNVPAANLYKDSGFTWVDYEDQYFGAGEPRDLLVHRITHDWAAAEPTDRRWRKDRGPVDDG